MYSQLTGRLKKRVVNASSLAHPGENQNAQIAGLLSGTRIATPDGWSPVQTIGVGDEVLTFDAGLQKVTHIEWVRLWDGKGTCPRAFWPLTVPSGVLGNSKELKILPGQNVMIESDIAEKYFGDPFSLIPAEATEGLHGVVRTPPEHAYFVVLLHFAQEQIVYSQSGALLFCPAFEDGAMSGANHNPKPNYTSLPMDKARLLAKHLGDEDTAACTYHPQGFGAAAVPA